MSNCNGVQKAPLTCQSTHVFLVIRKDKKIPHEKIEEYCKRYFSMYCWIEHADDIQPDTGVKEGCHYHIVGDFLENKIRFSKRLNDIADFFGFDNNFGLEIDKYKDLPSCVQYLIHKNNKEKTPHEVEEIHTNLGKEELDLFLNTDCEQLVTFDYIVSVCNRSTNKLQMISSFGIFAYEKHYKVINDIWSEINEIKKKI